MRENKVWKEGKRVKEESGEGGGRGEEGRSLVIQRPPSQHIVPRDIHEREVAQDGDDARLGDVLPEVQN